MSLNEITQPNSLELFAHSLTLSTQINQPVVGFRYSLFGGSTINVPSTFATGTFLANYGVASADDINYGSASFNNVTGIFTVPVSGWWHLSAGSLWEAFPPASVDTVIYVGISTPGNISEPFCVSTIEIDPALLVNWLLVTTGNVYLTAGTQLQSYVQQKSTQVFVLSASRYNFISGYLISTSSESPL